MPPPDSPRGDGLLFYSMAISSLIESTTPVYVENLLQIFANDSQTCEWLQTTWCPEELRHGRLMRQRIEQLWPELDFARAYAEFRKRYEPRCEASLLRPTPALEALARCVTEAQAAASYRALASYVLDPELAATFLAMAADEVRHFSYFRRTFERHNDCERHRMLKRLRIVVERTLLVRDEDLAVGFSCLDAHWTKPPPFAPLDYQRYLELLGEVMQQHFPMLAAARMLMQPVTGGTWLEDVATVFVPPFLRFEFGA
jgi:hypothetical protein